MIVGLLYLWFLLYLIAVNNSWNVSILPGRNISALLSLKSVFVLFRVFLVIISLVLFRFNKSSLYN